ncbi:nickel transporter [Methylovirgula ligni]|uniref:Phosphoribosylformimino-5-aminoimidazole carboxamide ribotide isomerase n=1 Tax=Methylovirgula ligni TaxID=569860 RepID=A0A3D9Z3D6_9HYPH|nr:HisA/HisF-related TIM barrel protein [Methylovirgula ligni]QAY95353.1 nickel transporter [Methylovirgula ligni]REF89335.1 phosphoribosylformimino-5-aminoimidazole carboxamide ribotide isomerase [Methylovirgula ligni]
MDVIPVIDLKAGAVVRASGGARHLYAPIETPLARTSRPRDVIAGFRALFPFKNIYIADLDAITGVGGHTAIISELEAVFPEIEFWVDSGIATENHAAAWLARHRGALVIGSESLSDLETLPRFDLPRRILSLDFRGDDFLGPMALATNPALWPQRIIVMTLAKVGAGGGPDFARLDRLGVLTQGKHDLYAAGGVRDADDLRWLESAGLKGVLVASALHDRKITASDLQTLNPK